MNRNILIVEDDKKIVETITLYLEREGYKVSAVFNGCDALKEARAAKPALIILDLMLPQLDGLEVCRILRAESDAYIIMLTARTTEQEKLRGLDLGADDYITKPFSPRELVARVRAVLRRERTESGQKSTEIRIKNLVINLERHEVKIGEQTIYLTPTEFKLLETFVKSPKRTFTRNELIERTFGDDYEGFNRTIDVHIMNLRKKIQTYQQEPSLIKTVFGVGYKLSLQNDVP